MHWGRSLRKARNNPVGTLGYHWQIITPIYEGNPCLYFLTMKLAMRIALGKATELPVSTTFKIVRRIQSVSYAHETLADVVRNIRQLLLNWQVSRPVDTWTPGSSWK